MSTDKEKTTKTYRKIGLSIRVQTFILYFLIPFIACPIISIVAFGSTRNMLFIILSLSLTLSFLIFKRKWDQILAMSDSEYALYITPAPAPAPVAFPMEDPTHDKNNPWDPRNGSYWMIGPGSDIHK